MLMLVCASFYLKSCLVLLLFMLFLAISSRVLSTPPQSYRLERPGTSGIAVGPEIAIFRTFEDDQEVRSYNTTKNRCASSYISA